MILVICVFSHEQLSTHAVVAADFHQARAKLGKSTDTQLFLGCGSTDPPLNLNWRGFTTTTRALCRDLDMVFLPAASHIAHSDFSIDY